MIEAPKPPTDNLYKFIAVSGVTLIIVALVFPVYLGSRDIDEIQKLHQAAEARLRETYFKHIELSGTSGMSETDRKKRTEAFETVETKLKESEVQKLRDWVDAKKMLYKVFAWLAWLAAIAGTGFMLFGFERWYRQVQKPQDAILMCEKQIRERELSAIIGRESGNKDRPGERG